MLLLLAAQQPSIHPSDDMMMSIWTFLSVSLLAVTSSHLLLLLPARKCSIDLFSIDVVHNYFSSTRKKVGWSVVEYVAGCCQAKL
jgi:hypothetical protein